MKANRVLTAAIGLALSCIVSFADAESYSYSTISDPLASGNTFAQGINNAGQIVGYYDSSGFLYSGSTYTTITDPLATGVTAAYGINNTGQIVGYYTDTTGAHAFVYSNGIYTTLNDPLATSGTYAFGVNDAGQIV